MSSRLNLLSDPRFSALQVALRERVGAAAGQIGAQTAADLLDPLMRDLLDAGFRAAGAHEGTLWLLDRPGEFLVPVFNTGPRADAVIGFRQPLSRGLISMVAATEQPFCENDVYRNRLQDPGLDRSLGVLTCAMAAVPFYFAGELRGVLSCVQLKRPDDPADPPGFGMESLRHLQRSALAVSRLIDHRLVGVTVGWLTE